MKHPKARLTDLRTDPFEFAKITSNTYSDWMFQHAYLIYAVHRDIHFAARRQP